jgi:hypothetical protein
VDGVERPEVAGALPPVAVAKDQTAATTAADADDAAATAADADSTIVATATATATATRGGLQPVASHVLGADSH